MTGAGAGTGRYVVPGLARGLRTLGRFDRERLRTELVEAVCETAGDISRSLGWREVAAPKRALRHG